jgi:hypothetical protein
LPLNDETPSRDIGQINYQGFRESRFLHQETKRQPCRIEKRQSFRSSHCPEHKNVDTGTLSSILDGAGMTADEFIELLK